MWDGVDRCMLLCDDDLTRVNNRCRENAVEGKDDGVEHWRSVVSPPERRDSG